VSDLHRIKQHWPKTSIDEGITISIISVRRNTRCSIRDNLDSDSNVSEISDSHPKNNFHPKFQLMRKL
jgi:hypothetical protein